MCRSTNQQTLNVSLLVRSHTQRPTQITFLRNEKVLSEGECQELHELTTVSTSSRRKGLYSVKGGYTRVKKHGQAVTIDRFLNYDYVRKVLATLRTKMVSMWSALPA